MFDTTPPSRKAAASTSSLLAQDMILSKMQPQAAKIATTRKRLAVHRASERSTASTCSSSTFSFDSSSVESQYQELFQELQNELDQAREDERYEDQGDEQQSSVPQDSSVPEFVSSERAIPETALLLDEMACEQDVIELLQKIRDALSSNQAQQQELQEKTEARFDMACGRVEIGCHASAKMATRRMHRVRLQLGRASTTQCRLMEMYSTVYDEWSRAKSTVADGHKFMVEVDVQHYLDAITKLEQEVDDMRAIPRTDKEMLEEVEHLCVQHQ